MSQSTIGTAGFANRIPVSWAPAASSEQPLVQSSSDVFRAAQMRAPMSSPTKPSLLDGLAPPAAPHRLNQPTERSRQPIDITDYITGAMSRPISGTEANRAIGAWIPGNRVRSFAHADLPTENHSAILRWLRETSEFALESIRAVFAAPEVTHSWEVNNPILEQPIASDLRETIRSAEDTLFVDIFLMGGTWGLDIAKELLLATERGVKVVVVRDTDNEFSSGFEMVPLWSALEEESYQNENLTVLRSDIHQRPSGLPFGLDYITQLIEPWVDMPLSLAAKSDHSKVVIADGLSPNPSMWIGSKNTVDSGGSYFFDEVMHIDGPAAAAAQVSYLEDITLAHDLALKERRNGGTPGDAWLTGFVEQLRRRRSGQERTWVQPVGGASVQVIENNADDSVRNVESSVLALLESAETSIDMYQFLAYSPSVAKALARAIKRGVRVRILMDSIEKKVPLNNMLAILMQDHGVTQSEIASCIRWRNQLPGGTQVDHGEEHPIEPQQQHTKTIIVDGEVTLAGSANFDIASLSGAFRELSVAVRDQQTASESISRFNAIFESDEHSAPYESAFTKPL